MKMSDLQSARIACEYGPIAAGARSVLMARRIVVLLSV
jgi:hypothetical protein